MVDIPPQAITAAMNVLQEAWGIDSAPILRTVLEAAFPHLAAHAQDAAYATGAKDAAAAERERCAQLAKLCDSILQAFTKTSDGYRARAGQVQIHKWEAALLTLKAGALTSGATVAEDYRDEKWRDAMS